MIKSPENMVLDTQGHKPASAEYWSQQAEEYNEAFSRGIERVLYAAIEAQLLQNYLRVSDGAYVLDLCCGCGRNTLALASGNPRWHLVGLDAAPGMLAVARRNAENRCCTNVTFVSGDCRNLPFSAETFDAVVGTRFMYMMPWQEKRQIIEECRRVLKPRGILALQFNNGFWGIKEELIRRVLWQPRPVRDRYLWPTQAARLFEGFQVDAITGIKLFWLGKLSYLIGKSNAIRLNYLLRLPFFRWFSAYLLVVGHKLA